MSLSCIIPNYNHGKYLHERLDSVLSQSFNNFECVYLDDNSIDNSNTIIKKYLNLGNRITVYSNDKNSGSTFYQWNKGVQYANGKYLTIQESDDISNINLFQTLYSAINKDKNIVLAFCQSYIVDSDSQVKGLWDYEDLDFSVSFVMDGFEFIQKYLIHKNVIPNASAVVFKKEIYELIGGANPFFKSNGDWLVWLKILCHGKIAFINEPLNYYRRHIDTVTFRNRQDNTLRYKELYSSLLRKEFNQYLKKINSAEFLVIKKINRKYISYDAGYYSLFLLKNKRYLKSIKQLLVATFCGGFKSYFFKIFLRDFNNRLFGK